MNRNTRSALECLAAAAFMAGACWLTFRAAESPFVGVGARGVFQLATVAFGMATLAFGGGFLAYLSRRFA